MRPKKGSFESCFKAIIYIFLKAIHAGYWPFIWQTFFNMDQTRSLFIKTMTNIVQYAINEKSIDGVLGI